jgi:pimeloyl-ACP methyl ester carboxylesterase
MPSKLLKLSFRTDNAGGDVRLVPDMADFYQRWDKRRLVLLIHGYNNTIPEAEAAYEQGFIRLQQALARHAPDHNIAPDRDFVEVFWKGDDWGFASFAYYMESIPNARKTAPALAQVLRTLALQRGGLEIDIVAHSLGTRLALELVRSIGVDSLVQIGKIVFFAAAVPTFMLVDPNERHGLRQAYDRAVKGGLLSLYSGNDIVLAATFPLGQSLAPGREGILPTALGHERWESHRVPATLWQLENSNAGHSDYWGWKQRKRKCEVFANAQARDFLGFTGLGDRQVASAEVAERDVPEAPPTAVRETPSRTV